MHAGTGNGAETDCDLYLLVCMCEDQLRFPAAKCQGQIEAQLGFVWPTSPHFLNQLSKRHNWSAALQLFCSQVPPSQSTSKTPKLGIFTQKLEVLVNFSACLA